MTGHCSPPSPSVSQSKLGSLVNHSARPPSSFMPKVQNTATRPRFASSSRACEEPQAADNADRRFCCFVASFSHLPLSTPPRKRAGLILSLRRRLITGSTVFRVIEPEEKNSARVRGDADIFHTARVSRDDARGRRLCQINYRSASWNMFIDKYLLENPIMIYSNLYLYIYMCRVVESIQN